MHETFDHTADLGLPHSSGGFERAFRRAAQALFSVFVENLDAVKPVEEFDVEIQGEDREYLLFDWLRELLYRFDAEHRLFSRFEVVVSDGGLKGSAWGEAYDPERHELGHEVKAITYHGLKVERNADGWLAEVIVDI